MLDILNRPKWEHKEPTVRLQAAVLLDANKPEDKAVLLRLAQEDAAEQVRRAALARLPLAALLEIQLAEQAYYEALWAAIELAAQAEQVDDERVGQALARLLAERPQAYKAWLLLCQQSELNPSILEKIETQADWAEIAVSARNFKLRALAAERLEDIEILKTVQKDASDKQVLQIVREKLKRQKAEQEAFMLQQQNAQKLCEQIEKLAPLPFDERYARRLQLLIEEWQQLDSIARAPYDTRFTVAHAQCRDNLETLLTAQQQHQAVQAARQIQIIACEALEQLQANLQTDANTFESPTLTQILGEQAQLWQQSQTEVPAEKETAERYYRTLEALQGYQAARQRLHEHRESLEAILHSPPLEDADYAQLKTRLQSLRSLQQTLAWPERFAIPPQLRALEDLYHQYSAQQETLLRQNKTKREHLRKKTQVLQKEISKRNLIAANRLYNYLEKRIDELDAFFQTRERDYLQQTEQALQELRDWHEFATRPKKIELCEKMEALSGLAISPPQLAERIKAMQQEWKELCSSYSANDQALWERFKAAADKAFEPCGAYYAEKDRQRQENLHQRERLCLRLETFYQDTDWHSISDWKQIEQLEKSAKQEWQALRDVPKKSLKGIQKRFDAALKPIRAKLDEARERHLAQRQELVTQAQGLAQTADHEDAIQRAIQLQQQWKQLGITYYKQDHEQWQLFRAACNQVFAARTEQRNAEQQQRQEQLSHLQTLIDALTALSETDDETLVKNRSRYQELRAEFQSALQATDKAPKKLQSVFQQACKQFQKQLEGVEQRKQHRHWENLQKMADICVQLENVVLQKREVNAQDLSSVFQQHLSLVSSKMQKRLQARFDAALALQTLSESECSEQAEQNKQRVMHSILELEVLCDLPSPDEIKDARLQYQLEQLQQGLVNSRPNREELRDKMLQALLDWYITGPLFERDRGALTARYQQLLQAYVAAR